jgi:hypothetical protein
VVGFPASAKNINLPQTFWIGSAAHPAFYSAGSLGVLLGLKASYRRVKLTIHFRLVPGLIMMESNDLFRPNTTTYTIISVQGVVYLNTY